MANWVCNKCTAPFAVGSPRCPEPTCKARDAHEAGGDPGVNVYDAVEATGETDPGDAWGTVNQAVAEARHELHRSGHPTKTQSAGVTAVLQGGGEGEVAERLGDVDVTYREPDPSLGRPDDERIGDDMGKVELEADDDGTGQHLPEAVEGDTTERVDDRSEGAQGEALEPVDSAGSAPAPTRKKRNVSS